MAGIGIRRSGRRGRDDLPLTADINVTSLVDVAFTLLVIFIITAPILQGGIDVNLPEANVRPLTSVEDHVIVSIRSDGTIVLEDETELTIEAFEQAFPQLARSAGTRQLLIRADAAAAVGPTVRVIAVAQAEGIATSFIVEPRASPGGG